MNNSLINRVETAKMNALVMRKYAVKGQEDEVERIIFEKEFEYIITEDLMKRNPDELLDTYTEYFAQKKLPIKSIGNGEKFYRGRIGYTTISGSIDDLSKEFILPYNGDEIKAPPPIHAIGGRFNRQGTSYLYLADDIETCLAEVHLQIGQACSIAEFICLDNIELIDLTNFEDDNEMQVWLKILTQPIHSDINYKYNETRFLADVFKTINRIGIYFDSVQANGHNIVCFNPLLFGLVQFSEKIYTARKIKYDIEELNDSIKEFSKNGKQNPINSYNHERENEIDEKFDYLDKWIEYKKNSKE